MGVYIYPKEFDTLPYYVLDYMMNEDNESILLAGAILNGGSKKITITWQIQTYSIDLDTMQFTPLEEKTVPVEIEPMQPYSEQQYLTTDKINSPLTKISLIQTPLNTYIRPEWREKEDQTIYRAVLLTADGIAVDRGSPLDADAYTVVSVPYNIRVSIEDNMSGSKIAVMDFSKCDNVP